jgi:GT2 family glycosyltransferase
MDETVTDIAVIILTKEQRERTLECLASLMALEEPRFHAIVWGNGSQDGTLAAIQEGFPKELVHHHPGNLGVASGCDAAANLAIKTFDPSYLLFFDIDMLVEPGFVSALREPFIRGDRIGQTQAKLRFLHDKGRNDGEGAQINFVTWKVTPIGYGEIDRGQHDTVKRCVACGGAMMVRSDLFQRLGRFDPAFDPFDPEDPDFSLRFQKAGYCVPYVPQAVAYHTVSHTFGEGYSEEYARHKSRHWFTFMRRHASPIEQLGFFLLGAPYLITRAIWREGRKGNLGALRGLVRGILDLPRPPQRSEGKE